MVLNFLTLNGIPAKQIYARTASESDLCGLRYDRQCIYTFAHVQVHLCLLEHIKAILKTINMTQYYKNAQLDPIPR